MMTRWNKMNTFFVVTTPVLIILLLVTACATMQNDSNSNGVRRGTDMGTHTRTNNEAEVEANAERNRTKHDGNAQMNRTKHDGNTQMNRTEHDGNVEKIRKKGDGNAKNETKTKVSTETNEGWGGRKTPSRLKALERQWGTREHQVKVKGIYVSGHAAGSRSRMNELIRLVVDSDELNAMVIDVKNDMGKVTYDSNVPLVNDIAADQKPLISSLEELLKQLKAKQVYTIARLVAFKDPYLAGKRPEYALKNKSGEAWRDAKGTAWVDPFHPDVRQYNMELAREAARLGFDEIQFDYVRFPENGKKVDQEVRYHSSKNQSKAELIAAFLQDASEILHEEKVYVSADVFGLTTTVDDDMGIGQEWVRIARSIDFISPMVYPSHYGKGMYGIVHPNEEPYKVVRRAMRDAKEKNKQLVMKWRESLTVDAQGHMVETDESVQRIAEIRPWLQSFTATWIKPYRKYATDQIRQQIKAVKEEGVESYLLWNPQCQYPNI